MAWCTVAVVNAEMAGHSTWSEVHAINKTSQLCRVLQLLSTSAGPHSMGQSLRWCAVFRFLFV